MQKAQSFTARFSSKYFNQISNSRSFARTLTKTKSSPGKNNDTAEPLRNKIETAISERKVEVVKITEDDLTPVQAWCLFNEGYERAFSGNLHEFEEVGTYHCGACDSKLFTSDQKLKDESGRPAFWYHKSGDHSGVLLEDFTPETWAEYKKTIDNEKIIPAHLSEPVVTP